MSAAGARAGADWTPPVVTGLAATNGDTRYSGDGRLLTTITPNGDGFRDRATIRFRLSEPAKVLLKIRQTKPQPRTVYARATRLRAGTQRLTWAPGPAIAPRTYLVSLRVTDGSGNAASYGAIRASDPRVTPVVRVQGVEARFERESYVRDSVAVLAIASDARSAFVQILRAGPEPTARLPTGTMSGVPVTDEIPVAGRRDAPKRVRIAIGSWPSGLYFAEIHAEDGRVGYAPFVLRPRLLGESRVAVVLPTYTWQAYNLRDADGSGFGDSWYAAWGVKRVRLGRSYLDRGVPPYFRYYDAPFLRWLARHAGSVDFLAQSDLERAASGAQLADAYDLLVFPGHHEYVSKREYDLVEAYRNLGGNLMFLSANNFYWRIVRRGGFIVRTAKWRDLGRPEARLIGVQYRANDRGQRRGQWVVRGADTDVAWIFEGTGLRNGSRFSSGGIEIDRTTPRSPRGTRVLAEIPNLYGRGVSAQMTYYETPAGAKVFAAGAFTVAGAVWQPPVRRIVENLWARLARPDEPPPTPGAGTAGTPSDRARPRPEARRAGTPRSRARAIAPRPSTRRTSARAAAAAG